MGVFFIILSFLSIAVLSFFSIYKIGEPVNSINNFVIILVGLFIFLYLSFSIFKFVVYRVSDVNDEANKDES